MKNLNTWIAIIIALLLTTQSTTHATDAPKTKCVESLRKVEKIVGEYKKRATVYWSDVYKSKGLRLFVTDSHYLIDKPSPYNYVPLKNNYNIMSRLSNLATLLNPFRWIGIILKNQQYKFAPITPIINYWMTKKSGKAKKLSRFSSYIIHTTVIVAAYSAIASENNRSAQEILEDQMQYVIENREYFNEQLMKDYRYASIDKNSQDQINLTVSELYGELQTIKEGTDEINKTPPLEFRKQLESQSAAHDSITNNALLQVYWLEQEYKKYYKNTEDLLTLNVEENISRFCDNPMFYRACILAKDIPEEHEEIAKEAFDLTHMLYGAYNLVDSIASQHSLDNDSIFHDIKKPNYGGNWLIRNSEKFLNNMITFSSEGLIPTHQLNWFLKRDMDLQFNMRINAFEAILDGTLTGDKLQNIHSTIDEKMNTIRAATEFDIQQSSKKN